MMIGRFFPSPVDKLVEPWPIFGKHEFPNFRQKCVLKQNKKTYNYSSRSLLGKKVKNSSNNTSCGWI